MPITGPRERGGSIKLPGCSHRSQKCEHLPMDTHMHERRTVHRPKDRPGSGMVQPPASFRTTAAGVCGPRRVAQIPHCWGRASDDASMTELSDSPFCGVAPVVEVFIPGRAGTRCASVRVEDALAAWSAFSADASDNAPWLQSRSGPGRSDWSFELRGRLWSGGEGARRAPRPAHPSGRHSAGGMPRDHGADGAPPASDFEETIDVAFRAHLRRTSPCKQNFAQRLKALDNRATRDASQGSRLSRTGDLGRARSARRTTGAVPELETRHMAHFHTRAPTTFDASVRDRARRAQWGSE